MALGCGSQLPAVVGARPGAPNQAGTRARPDGDGQRQRARFLAPEARRRRWPVLQRGDAGSVVPGLVLEGASALRAIPDRVSVFPHGRGSLEVVIALGIAIAFPDRMRAID